LEVYLAAAGGQTARGLFACEPGPPFSENDPPESMGMLVGVFTVARFVGESIPSLKVEKELYKRIDGYGHQSKEIMAVGSYLSIF